MSTDELQRLARRSAGGDLEAARRVVSLLEVERGAPAARFWVESSMLVAAENEDGRYVSMPDNGERARSGPFVQVRLTLPSVGRRVRGGPGWFVKVEGLEPALDEFGEVRWTSAAYLVEDYGGWQEAGGARLFARIEIVDVTSE